MEEIIRNYLKGCHDDKKRQGFIDACNVFGYGIKLKFDSDHEVCDADVAMRVYDMSDVKNLINK